MCVRGDSSPSARVRLAYMGAEEEVIAAARERASALALGDAERLSGLLHEDFRWTTPEPVQWSALRRPSDYEARGSSGWGWKYSSA